MELWLSQNIRIGSSSKIRKSFTNPHNHDDSLAPLDIAQYSTLVEEKTTMGYFLDIQVTPLEPMQNTNHEVECH
jgi:hypothetical protein